MRTPALLALCLGSLTACGPDLEALDPLLGRWTSADPRFEGCTLSFDANGYLRLWNKEEHSQVCRILAIEPLANGALTLAYETAEGTEDKLELSLLEDGRLRLRNQEIPWERR